MSRNRIFMQSLNALTQIYHEWNEMKVDRAIKNVLR